METLETADGLTIEYDEENSTLKLSWDSETHPQWDFLSETDGEIIVKAIEQSAQNILDKHDCQLEQRKDKEEAGQIETL